MTDIHPYRSDPAPKSLVQPWLIIELKELKVPFDDIQPDYPYSIPKAGLGPNAKGRIPYFEFRGVGSPLDLDVGSPGDVYIDLTPEAYALWGHTADGWKRWIDMGDPAAPALGSMIWAVRHPFVPYSLWVCVTGTTQKNHISWFKNLYYVRSTRQWAERLGLYEPVVGGAKKDIQTACKEASAMLGQLDDLFGLQSPDLEYDANLLQTATPELPDHPHLIDASTVHPHLAVKLKSFTVHDLPASYPFRLQSTNASYRVPYLEVSGMGPPTAELDVGLEGDVYLDLTPGGYALYGKVATGWKRWGDTGEKGLSGTEWPDADWVVRHPQLEDRALWVAFSRAGKGSIGWRKGPSAAREARTMAYKLGLVKKNVLPVSKSEDIMNGEAANVLEFILEGEGLQSLSKPNTKRAGTSLSAGSRKKFKSEDPELRPFFMGFESDESQ
ncbi:hypothetical protein DFH06DRAFT_1172605 [Mycena polygramma]|nr:hypothetical protein DFH06DRAFT_1172605 [Mycena polygramma]